ncbi:hypothetical protein EIP86_011230 [Pleurotus ostreatoroseus]|nr:hypothetical protein EIP86_011230 [Pleurotus ostreatoroseus]
MSIKVAFLNNMIHRNNPVLQKKILAFVAKSKEVKLAELKGATEAYIRGPAHANKGDPWWHWTVSYHAGDSTKEVLPKDHIYCPFNLLPLWVRKAIKSTLAQAKPASPSNSGVPAST